MPLIPEHANLSANYHKKMEQLRREAQKEAAPAPRQSADKKKPSSQLKSGRNEPKGTPTASDPTKAWAASQTRSTERKS